jgi:deoxyribodipyrimidine photolyase-related protein
MSITTKELRLILGDQLNQQHSWFTKKDPSVLYVLMEIRSETDYVVHHIQKVLAFFSAMRQFANWLELNGHRVHYIRLDDTNNQHQFGTNLLVLQKKHQAISLVYQLPDEYRVDQELKQLELVLNIPVSVVDTEHFLTTRTTLRDHFEGKKTFLMESFYRMIRRKTGFLMEGEMPVTGRWNYDAENRSGYKANIHPPSIPDLRTEVGNLLEVLKTQNIKTMGSLEGTILHWPTSRQSALLVLHHFCENLLPYFGQFQDMMSAQEPFLFHSRLSFAMNVKLISPSEVCEAAIAAWQKNQAKISVAQVEGFVRQVAGWREYVRGVYWAKMPDYALLNYFDAKRPIPSWFWNGETRMNCLKHAIGQSLSEAYAHHIQRLMVTGAFLLLAGIDPNDSDAWYLGIYIDALEWVEMPNTRGMSQFADGGIVGTKPYAGSSNYIDKMSNYCKTCFYDRKKKHGDRACPFNSLYWNFYQRNRLLLEKNPRIGMAYITWDKFSSEEQKALITQATHYLQTIDTL